MAEWDKNTRTLIKRAHDSLRSIENNQEKSKFYLEWDVRLYVYIEEICFYQLTVWHYNDFS